MKLGDFLGVACGEVYLYELDEHGTCLELVETIHCPLNEPKPEYDKYLVHRIYPDSKTEFLVIVERN